MSVPGHAAATEDSLPGVSARTEKLVWVGVGIAVLVLLATAATRTEATVTLGAMTIGLVIVAGRQVLLAWPTLLGAIILLIIFVPVRRYTLGGGFPFQLEPYRVAIALVAFVWLAAVLADPATKFKRTGFEAPLILFGIAAVASLVTNPGRASSLSGDVLRMASTWAGFITLMYLSAGAITTRRALDRTLMVLVGAATVVAVLAVIESRTTRNYFNELERFFPVLDYNPDGLVAPSERGGEVRAYASAQHAIPLGAMLVMLFPFALYLWKRTGQRWWLGSGVLLVMGALATTSRTAVVMLFVTGLVFLWLKRAETVRMLPLVIPLLLVIQIAMPGTLGGFRAIFFPEQGLIAEEQAGEGTGTGRLQDVGPSLEEWGRQPFFGQGFGTRLTSMFDHIQNARILDDQWLSSLLEIGAVGVGALLWLLIRAIRRLKLLAKHDGTDYGWLLTAMAAAIYAFGIGMLTYDAFSFIQVTFLLFLLLGLAAAAISLKPRAET